jgi:hypothetical protein
MRQLVEGAKRALGSASTVRRSHTQARKGIEEAAGHFDALLRDVDAALREIGEELAR